MKTNMLTMLFVIKTDWRFDKWYNISFSIRIFYSPSTLLFSLLNRLLNHKLLKKKITLADILRIKLLCEHYKYFTYGIQNECLLLMAYFKATYKRFGVQKGSVSKKDRFTNSIYNCAPVFLHVFNPFYWSSN